jgi:hypothetical protein
MAITQYCHPDEVRAALGVNLIELPDNVISLPIYEIGLVRELARVATILPAQYLAAAAKSPEDLTANEKALKDACRMFSAYTCARQVGAALGHIAPKDVGDGKATLGRFSGDPYKDVLTRVAELLAAAKADLLTAYAVFSGGTQVVAKPLAVFAASSRSYDPVTGS